MDTKTKKILLWSGVAILVIAGIVILILAFSGSDEPATDDVNVIYTDAALTVAAQQQTLQAGTFVATPTPTISSPTVAPTLLPTSTQQQTPVVLPTIKPPAGTVTTGCDNSAFITDVTIPDGTVIPAGQSFTKTWRVSNTGYLCVDGNLPAHFHFWRQPGRKGNSHWSCCKPGSGCGCVRCADFHICYRNYYRYMEIVQ